jgi:O-methyltransferase
VSEPQTHRPCRGLYIDLLEKSLTNTVFDPEPDPDNPNRTTYVAGVFDHYIKGRAVTFLSRRRLENLHNCIAEVLQKGIAGDLIETGVWRGGATIFMRALLEAYGDTKRSVWVADSFEGLPEPDAKRFPKEADSYRNPILQRHGKNLAVSLPEVRANFAAYGLLDERVRFLKGWFKDTLPTAPIERLALMRLDGDYYESTRDALTSLYDKLSPGGFVIIDDYGDDDWTYCRQAVDQFREERGIRDPLIAVDSKCHWWRRMSST